MLCDKRFHFFFAHSFHRTDIEAVLRHIVLDQLICTEPFLAAFAVHQRVVEAAYMTGSDPYLRVHQNGCVKADVVRAFLHELLPPRALHIVFEFYAERTVIPRICEPAVYLRAGIYKAAPFCERYDLVHCFFHRLPSKIL